MELEDKAKMLIAKLCHLFIFQFGHVHAIYDDRSCVGGVKRAHDLQECGLSCSRWTYDADHLSLFANPLAQPSSHTCAGCGCLIVVRVSEGVELIVFLLLVGIDEHEAVVGKVCS